MRALADVESADRVWQGTCFVRTSSASRVSNLKLLASQFSCTQDYRFIEHYAGVGEMTRAAHEEFGLSVALDKEYHRAMNILTPAGFATLSSVNLFLLRNFFEYTTFDLRALLHDYEDPFGQCPSLL